MSKELLDQLIQQVEKLTIAEKHLLSDHLLSKIKQVETAPGSHTLLSRQSVGADLERRKQHIQWLKDHQAEYAGQYVALDGYGLVAQGKTFVEVYQAAQKAGVKKPFVTHVFPPDSTIFGGW